MRAQSIPAMALFVCAVALGCGGSSASVPNVTGVWSGTVEGSSRTVTLTIAQDGSQISGSGEITDASGTDAVVMSGDFSVPEPGPTGTAAAHVEMTIARAGEYALAYTATLDGNSMHGLLDGWDSLTLTRQ